MPTLLQVAASSAGALSLLGGGLWYASAWPESQLFGPVLVAGTDPDEVALTFDDGPNDAATPQLLEALAVHSVRATFFCIGERARRQPALLRQISAAGHIVANHTLTHPRLSFQPAARIRQELAGCNALLEDILGTPVRFFRPPFGARRPRVLHIARELGLTPVLWNVAGYDWKPIGPQAILLNLQDGIERNRDGLLGPRSSNLLLHDGGHRALEAPRQATVLAIQQLLAAHHGTTTRFVTADAWSQ